MAAVENGLYLKLLANAGQIQTTTLTGGKGIYFHENVSVGATGTAYGTYFDNTGTTGGGNLWVVGFNGNILHKGGNAAFSQTISFPRSIIPNDSNTSAHHNWTVTDTAKHTIAKWYAQTGNFLLSRIDTLDIFTKSSWIQSNGIRLKAPTSGTPVNNVKIDANGDLITAPLDTSATNTYDVFVFNGQSNGVGESNNPTVAPKSVPGNLVYRFGALIPAGEPVMGYLADAFYKGGALTSLGNRYFNITGRHVIFINQCKAATALIHTADVAGNGYWDNFNYAASLTTQSIARTRTALDSITTLGKKVGNIYFVWMQGEQDAYKISTGVLTQAAYTDTLVRTANRFRTALSKTAPFFVIRTGAYNHPPDADYMGGVRNAQEAAPAKDSLLFVIARDAVTFPAAGYMNADTASGKFHYSQPGYDRLGDQAAVEMITEMRNRNVILRQVNHTGFGGVTEPTAFVDILGGTTAEAPFRMRAGVDPTSPNDGEFNNNSTSHNLYTWLNGTKYRMNIPNFTAGSIPYSDGTNLVEDNTNLRWNTTYKGINIGPAPTVSTAYQLTAVGANSSIALEKYNTTPTVFIGGYSSRGTSQSATLPIVSLDNILQISAWPNYATGTAAYNTQPAASIKFTPVETPTSSAQGTVQEFFVTPKTTNTPLRGMMIGNLGTVYATSGGTAGTEPTTYPTRLYAKSVTADSSGVVFDGGTSFALMLRNNNNPNTNRLRFSMNTTTDATIDATVLLKINTTGNAGVTFGTGPFTVGSGTGIGHYVSGLLSKSPIVAADITNNTITYAKMQAGTATRIYGTGTGTAFEEMTALGTQGVSVVYGAASLTYGLGAITPTSINTVVLPATTFQSGTGTTADSLTFTASQHRVAKLTSGTNGISLGQTATTFNVSIDTTVIRTVANSVSLAGLQTRLTGLGDAVNTATDANYVITTSKQFIKLPVVTANRTVSIPAAASYTGQQIRILNSNTSGTFSWSFTGATVKDAASNTLTTLVNTSVYMIESDGTNWYKLN